MTTRRGMFRMPPPRRWGVIRDATLALSPGTGQRARLRDGRLARAAIACAAMRVLMLNAFHWPKGGVERALFDESRWLAAAGVEVGHFATRDPRNAPSALAAHF